MLAEITNTFLQDFLLGKYLARPKNDSPRPFAVPQTVKSSSIKIIDADENRDVAIADILNAFVQTVVEDEKDRAFIRIRGPLVDILVDRSGRARQKVQLKVLF